MQNSSVTDTERYIRLQCRHNPERKGCVHIANEDGGPLCGYTPRSRRVEWVTVDERPLQHELCHNCWLEASRK